MEDDRAESWHGPQRNRAPAKLRDRWVLLTDRIESHPTGEMAVVALSVGITIADEEEDPDDVIRALDEANGKPVCPEPLPILARDLGQADNDDLDRFSQGLDVLGDA